MWEGVGVAIGRLNWGRNMWRSRGCGCSHGGGEIVERCGRAGVEAGFVRVVYLHFVYAKRESCVGAGIGIGIVIG